MTDTVKRENELIRLFAVELPLLDEEQQTYLLGIITGMAIRNGKAIDDVVKAAM